MSRKAGTPNTLQIIIDEIVRKHQNGVTVCELATEYRKPIKKIKNMINWETAQGVLYLSSTL